MRHISTYPPIFLLAALFITGSAKSQQDPMYTMYMWNMMTVNPGYAGSADAMNLTALARRQWVGFDGGPATNTFMAHSPLNVRALGLGLSAVDDKIGPSRSTGVFMDLAYRIKVTKQGARLAFGMKAGFNSLRMDLSSVSGVQADDPMFQQDIGGRLQPNFGFGLYYWSRNGYFGLSAPKLLRTSLTVGTESGQLRVYQEQLHYFLIGGYVFKLTDKVRFRPSAIVRVVNGAPLSSEFSANFLFMERFWAGIAYRSSRDLALILSIQVNDRLRIGYSYDYSLNSLRSQHGGSHEVMLSYDLFPARRPIRSPRYF